jgi:hypothetical protein
LVGFTNCVTHLSAPGVGRPCRPKKNIWLASEVKMGAATVTLVPIGAKRDWLVVQGWLVALVEVSMVEASNK